MLQTLSNLLWGFCKLDVYPQELFEAAADELVERWACRPAPAVAVDSACGGGGGHTSALAGPDSNYGGCRFRTPELARQFRAQELSNSLYVSPADAHATTSGCRLTLPHPIFRCAVVQAFAQGNIINEQLLGAFERELSTDWVELDSSGRERRVSRLDDFTSQALANTLWSFAYLRWYPVQLLEPITRAVGRKLQTMSTQEISNSIWSFAK